MIKHQVVQRQGEKWDKLYYMLNYSELVYKNSPVIQEIVTRIFWSFIGILGVFVQRILVWLFNISKLVLFFNQNLNNYEYNYIISLLVIIHNTSSWLKWYKFVYNISEILQLLCCWTWCVTYSFVIYYSDDGIWT